MLLAGCVEWPLKLSFRVGVPQAVVGEPRKKLTKMMSGAPYLGLMLGRPVLWGEFRSRASPFPVPKRAQRNDSVQHLDRPTTGHKASWFSQWDDSFMRVQSPKRCQKNSKLPRSPAAQPSFQLRLTVASQPCRQPTAQLTAAPVPMPMHRHAQSLLSAFRCRSLTRTRSPSASKCLTRRLTS